MDQADDFRGDWVTQNEVEIRDVTIHKCHASAIYDMTHSYVTCLIHV